MSPTKKKEPFPFAPLLRYKWKTLSEDALKVIQDHLNPKTNKGVTTRGSSTSGVQSEVHLRNDPKLKASLPFTGKKGKQVKVQTGGGRTHSYNASNFGRPGDHSQPKGLTPQQRQLRSAAQDYLLGRAMEGVKPGESIGGRPLDRIRARLFKQKTNGVMETQPNGNINTRNAGNVPGVGKNTWETPKGDIDFDPKQLKRPLANAAVKMASRLAGPYGQAALVVDEAVAGLTGHRPSKVIKDEHIKANTKAIEERLRRGQRLIPSGLKF